MKTKIFILGMLLSLFNVSLPAQYFYETFGDAADIKLTGGTSTLAMGLGNLVAGVNGNGNQIHVTRTDLVGGMMFNNYYTLTAPSGTVVVATSAQVVELSASVIIVMGSYRDPLTLAEGFYYLRLNASGTVTSQILLPWTGATVSNMVVNGIHAVQSQGIFLAGTVRYTTAALSQTLPFAAKFSAAGVAQWARIYSPGTGSSEVFMGADIEFFSGSNELFLCGIYRATSTSTSDGFVMKLLPASGIFVGAHRWGGPNTNESFSGITTCSSLALGGTKGLLVAGQTNQRTGTNYDAWAMKIGFGLNTLGEAVYDYSPTANQNNFCSDVVERFNPASGLFTYFYTGWVSGGIIGLNDMHVIKTNDLMGSTGNYTYGTAALDEFGDCADINEATNGGLGVYGYVNTTATNRDFLIVGTYFNGITVDNTSCRSVSATPNTTVVTSPWADFVLTPLNSVSPITPTVTTLAVPYSLHCTAAVVSGGSNAKTAEGDDADAQDFNIDINAVSGVSNLSAITLSATESVNATVEVVNLLGATLFHCEMKLNEGNNTLPGTGDLATGIVVVRVVAENGMVFTKKVLIQ